MAASCTSSGLGKALSQWPAVLVQHLARGQSLGQALLLAEIARLVPEMRPGDAGAAMPAGDAAVRVLAVDFIEEQVL